MNVGYGLKLMHVPLSQLGLSESIKQLFLLVIPAVCLSEERAGLRHVLASHDAPWLTTYDRPVTEPSVVEQFFLTKAFKLLVVLVNPP